MVFCGSHQIEITYLKVLCKCYDTQDYTPQGKIKNPKAAPTKVFNIASGLLQRYFAHIHFEDLKCSWTINCSKIREAGWKRSLLCFTFKSSCLSSAYTSDFSWQKEKFPSAVSSVFWPHRNVFMLLPSRTTRGSVTLAVPGPTPKSCWNLCSRGCAG